MLQLHCGSFIGGCEQKAISQFGPSKRYSNDAAQGNRKKKRSTQQFRRTPTRPRTKCGAQPHKRAAASIERYKRRPPSPHFSCVAAVGRIKNIAWFDAEFAATHLSGANMSLVFGAAINNFFARHRVLHASSKYFGFIDISECTSKLRTRMWCSTQE